MTTTWLASEHLMAHCGISVVDALDVRTTDADFSTLQSIHFRHFPGHEHVVGELAIHRQADHRDALRHAWLLKRDAQPIGEVLFNSVPGRRTVLMHFVAVDEEHRKDLPLGWFVHLIDAVEATADADLRAVGSQARGVIAEVDEAATARWVRAGFVVLPVDYLEPHHGMHWRLHGEPTFFSMTPVLRPLPAGTTADPGELAAEAVSAFLLDHYRLDPDHPTVVTALRQAREWGRSV